MIPNIKLLSINWLKTFYFNLKYFPINIAVKLPFLIYKRTDLYKMSGEIILNVKPKFGLVKIGPHGLGTQDILAPRTIWQMNGKLIVNGRINIGRGSSISVGANALLSLGDNFIITGRSSIICQKKITFGNDCLLSWDILIMDTDFHYIMNENNEITNFPSPICIGNHVWIGCRNTILKGVKIANNVIISANSTLTKSVLESNCIVGGQGKEVAILKRGIKWEL